MVAPCRCLDGHVKRTLRNVYGVRNLTVGPTSSLVRLHIYFSYTGQENPNGSVVLDFSVWYCLPGTELPVC